MAETEERVIPDAVQARKPTLETQARETLGLPAEWAIMRWEAKGDHPHYYGVLVTGAVPGPLKTRGKNKGKPNWSKRSLEASVTITKTAEKTWLAAWEGDTGFCHTCWGTGRRFRSWSADTGLHFDACARCGATGLAPTQPEASPHD